MLIFISGNTLRLDPTKVILSNKLLGCSVKVHDSRKKQTAQGAVGCLFACEALRRILRTNRRNSLLSICFALVGLYLIRCAVSENKVTILKEGKKKSVTLPLSAILKEGGITDDEKAEHILRQFQKIVRAVSA